jgi:polyether ionophore transport system permease protein
MWFRNVYLKTLRDFRIGIFGWGIGTGLLLYAVFSVFPSLVTTPQARASLVALSQGFSWLVEPVKVDTPGGYATFKYGSTLLLISLWAISAASRILRGEEERGSMDVLLSLPEGRLRLALEKLAAVWTALLAMGLLIALITFAGAAGVHADLTFANAALFAFNIVLVCALFAGIALLLSQFTGERGPAAGIAGLLLVMAIVLDMVHRVIPHTEWISQLSPVYYYNLSRPLIPGYGANAAAMVGLLAVSALLSGIAIALFARRDVGGVIQLPGWSEPRPGRMPREHPLPANQWSLRSVYARGLEMIARATFWWTVGIAGFAVWMVVVAKQMESALADMVRSSPLMQQILASAGGSSSLTIASILSGLFTFLPLALMAFDVVQANHWAADEEEGRLELVLATPQPRMAVLGGRFAALTTANLLIGVVTLVATIIASTIAGVNLDGGKLAAAALAMIPLGLLIAALGYLFSGWLKTAFDTGLLSFLLVAWFFISFVGPDFKWPDATLRLSPFYYYGTPMIHGLDIGGTLVIAGMTVLALLIASFRFVRKDIAV